MTKTVTATVTDDEYLARAINMLKKTPSCDWKDMIIDVANPQKLVARYQVREENVAYNGFVFAGIMMGIADLLCGFGTLINLPRENRLFATQESTTTFVGTVKAGEEITFTVTPSHIGRSTQVWDAQVTQSSTGRTLTMVRVLQKIF